MLSRQPPSINSIVVELLHMDAAFGDLAHFVRQFFEGSRVLLEVLEGEELLLEFLVGGHSNEFIIRF
jgi:hypothetical protein